MRTQMTIMLIVGTIFLASLGSVGRIDKAELYGELGVNLTYHPEGRVSAEMLPRGVNVLVGGAPSTSSTRDP